LQLFQKISYLDLGEGEAGEAWASSCRGCGAVGQGWGSQEESMASRREMLLEILDYRGVIGADSVSWDEVLLFSIDFTVCQNCLKLELQDANSCLKKLAFAFLTVCIGS
jgi:hypothetical protein